jgi:hypothetical protein
MALYFNNKTNQTKFSGSINYGNSIYDYEIFLLPVKDISYRNEIINRITNRIRNGQVCLDITEDLVKDTLDYDGSAYGFVREKGTQDEGSGSLQIYNWCSLKRKGNSLDNIQVWINDVCRITAPNTKKSVISPVKVLFYLFEQLIIHNIQKEDVYLMVEPKEGPILVPIYNTYGFTIVSPTDCPKNKGKDASIIMRKTITIDPNYANFPFEQPLLSNNIGTQQSAGKKTKTRRYKTYVKISKRKAIKRKIIKRKTIKRKINKK